MRREHRSRTVARNTGPSPVLTSLKSPHHFWLIPPALKSRRSRSVGAVWARFWLVRPFLLLGRACNPWRAIDAPTVFFDTDIPSRRSWALALGDPQVPPDLSNALLTSASVAWRRSR